MLLWLHTVDRAEGVRDRMGYLGAERADEMSCSTTQGLPIVKLVSGRCNYARLWGRSRVNWWNQ